MLAHSTLTEIADQIDFDEWFQKLIDIVDKFFKELDPTRWRKWRNILHQIRNDDIGTIKDPAPDFEKEAAAIKAQEPAVPINFTGNNIAGNVNFIINLIGDKNPEVAGKTSVHPYVIVGWQSFSSTPSRQ